MKSIALVTGGTRGLGLAVVEALAADGTTVILAGRRPNAVRDVVASFASTGVKVTSVCPGWVQTDLAPGNREHAPTTPAEAAQVVVRAARLPDDAASGTFLQRRRAGRLVSS